MWVVITGASAGLGADFARLFAADGHPLVLIARRRERLEALAESLPTETRVLVQDLAHPQAAAKVTAYLEDQKISPDVLVNNAGFGLRGAFAQLDRERQLEMIRLNVSAAADLMRRLLPGMIERKSGGVLNVASLAGFQPGPNMAVYYATKAFLLHLSEGVAEEVRDSGVTVSAFCPGPVATEFSEVAGLGNPVAYGFWTMSSEKSARLGYRGFKRGKTIIVPGVVPKIANFLNWLVPRCWVRKIVGKMQ
ncbi:MAG: SDR family NAD(P)-dependent oxidoreductase [Planctomycetota bacterium]|jgi:short-subunit dehydrogenase